MCGIAGKLSFGKTLVTEANITQMTDAIAHRGPDDSGSYLSKDKKVGLGQRRLSIIDLSPAGHQPMNFGGRYWIVFNGEIYNYQEKREALLADGVHFVSQTDTEVILALYDRYKEKCVDHLRGMFAFAIYDEKEQTLFCARDRVGKKPFKYYADQHTFMFGSELKAILTQPEYKKEVDYTAIHHYLTLQYVPAPMTGFKNLKKLEPGHYLLVDVKTGKIKKHQYWRLDYSQKLDQTEEAWKEQIIDKLDESVRLRMIADVPLGAFLSGGIDSSAVVGLMSKHSSTPVKTFSIGFKEQSHNELPYARIVAEKFKTDHTEFIVEPQAIDILPMLVRQYEEPYADSSALATYYVSKMTREHVTVALNGDGGDENFAGYGRYSVQQFGLMYDKFRLLNQYATLPATRLLANTIKTTLTNRMRQFAESATDDYRTRYVDYICYFSNDMKAKLYDETFKNKVWDNDTYQLIAKKFDEAKTSDKRDQTLYADFTTYLPDDLLVKVDIATMTVALEGRSPFLDHELLELTAKIPFGLKLRGANDKKYILKKALEGLVPNEVMYRPKMGFGVPIEHWFRGQLNDYIKDILLSEKAASRGIFDQAAIRSLIDEHANTKINHAHRLWALLTLELWFREYFDAA